MNKILTYVILILIFLGMSASFSPSERGTEYIVNEKVYAHFFKGAPISLILVEASQNGFMIKTHYHTYKLISPFKPPETITIRTSKEFWTKNLKNIGMSLFRRKNNKKSESTLALPPGSLYIGDLAYGYWKLHDSGERFWKFHRGHRHLKHRFGWVQFAPSRTFFKKMQYFISNNQAFYGLNNEFGTEGVVTKNSFNNRQAKHTESKLPFLQFLKKFVDRPKSMKKDKKNERAF